MDLSDSFAKVKQCWSHFGSTEPFWSVLTHNKYKIKAVNPDALSEFWASGEKDFQRLESIAQHLGTTLHGKTVLDYGCGTGRIALAASKHAAHVLAVDISAGHLERARAQMEERDISNVSLVLLENLEAALPGPYDVAYSLIVLQHNRPNLMRKCIAGILQGLTPSGGLAMLHIPTAMPYSGQSNDPYTMEMHCLPVPELHAVATENGCEIVHVHDIDCCGGGIENAIYVFRRS